VADILHQMIHKGLQRHVVREDGLRCLGADAAISTSSVRRRRVQLGQQETSLRSTGITNNEPGQGETVRNEILLLSVTYFDIKITGDAEASLLLRLLLAAPIMRQSSRSLPGSDTRLSATGRQSRRGR
jgi:hypothetical protein